MIAEALRVDQDSDETEWSDEDDGEFDDDESSDPDAVWVEANPPPFNFSSFVRPMAKLPIVGKAYLLQDHEDFVRQTMKGQGWMYAGQILTGIPSTVRTRGTNIHEIMTKDVDGAICKVSLDFRHDKAGHTFDINILIPTHTVLLINPFQHTTKDGTTLVWITEVAKVSVVPLNMEDFLKINRMIIDPLQWCYHCHKGKRFENLLKCQKCGTKYCSRQCQLDDWPAHNRFCKGMIALRLLCFLPQLCWC